MSARLAFAVAALAVSAGPAATTASAAWTAPVVVDPTSGSRAGFSPSGNLLVSGDFQHLRAISRDGGAFGVPANVFDAPDTEMVFGAGADAQDRLTVVTIRRHKPYQRVRVAVREPGGSFGPERTISAKGHSATQPHIAVAPDGSAVAAWSWHDPAGWRVQAAVRKPGEATFGAPQMLSDPDAKDRPWVDVAAGDGGHGIVTWHFGGSYTSPSEKLLATTVAPDGTFAAPVTLDDGAGFYETALSAGADGRALVAWEPTYFLDRGDKEPAVLKVAEAAGGEAFGAARQLAKGGPGFVDQGNPTAELTADGAVVAWARPTAAGHGKGIVEAFTRTGADWGAGQALSDDSREPAGLVMSAGPDGKVALAWGDAHFATGDKGPNWESRVAIRAPGAATFAAAERVSDPEHNGLWPTVTVAPDGSVLAAWTANDDGSGGGTVAAATFAP